ncbi:hypothetical protein BOTNAR_0377g00010 [Botryotinia narcissicola]|uniref:Uncharacterized protein n=1 Tax=Botryotinia narcissicola TaxID=278944 RepID=A0A4Z1HQ20_9HELO|nr:hypothetical protein BOTNAR_0377g00010 [Botryotinia narcissicola]
MNQVPAFTSVRGSRDGKETTKGLSVIDDVENSVYLGQENKQVWLTWIVPFSNTVASNHQVRQNAYFETGQQPEQEHEQIEYEHNEAFMYDYASQCPSPNQTYPAYAMPYPHYPSWCV